MATYPFLSDDWLTEARAIRAEFDGKGQPIPHSVRMNLVITAVPFGEGTVNAHMDTTSGQLELDMDHIDPADLKVTLDYDIAKAILIEGNPQAGKVKVEGDIAKLMAMQTSGADPTTEMVAARIKAMTE